MSRRIYLGLEDNPIGAAYTWMFGQTTFQIWVPHVSRLAKPFWLAHKLFKGKKP